MGQHAERLSCQSLTSSPVQDQSTPSFRAACDALELEAGTGRSRFRPSKRKEPPKSGSALRLVSKRHVPSGGPEDRENPQGARSQCMTDRSGPQDISNRLPPSPDRVADALSRERLSKCLIRDLDVASAAARTTRHAVSQPDVLRRCDAGWVGWRATEWKTFVRSARDPVGRVHLGASRNPRS